MSSKENEDFTREEREAMERVLWMLDDLRKLKGNLSVHHAMALLRVALGQGKSVAELTKEAGVPQSVMSRHLLDLGPMDRNRDPGMGLIEYRLSKTNLLVHEVILTRKGLAKMKQLVSWLLPSNR
jgi:DNA-binding MarR family transcriptional regulator